MRVEASVPTGGGVVVGVEDDGPDLTTDADVFEPGVSTTGSGLGLPLARRVARSAVGDVVLARRAGPTRFEVRLPVA